jgi:hypothetical protein
VSLCLARRQGLLLDIVAKAQLPGRKLPAMNVKFAPVDGSHFVRHSQIEYAFSEMKSNPANRFRLTGPRPNAACK